MPLGRGGAFTLRAQSIVLGKEGGDAGKPGGDARSVVS